MAGAVIGGGAVAGAGNMFSSFGPPVTTKTVTVMARPMITIPMKQKSPHKQLLVLESAIFLTKLRPELSGVGCSSSCLPASPAL